MNSNPMPGEELRQEIIDFERDPEKAFLIILPNQSSRALKKAVLRKPRIHERRAGSKEGTNHKLKCLFFAVNLSVMRHSQAISSCIGQV